LMFAQVMTGGMSCCESGNGLTEVNQQLLVSNSFLLLKHNSSSNFCNINF